MCPVGQRLHAGKCWLCDGSQEKPDAVKSDRLLTQCTDIEVKEQQTQRAVRESEHEGERKRAKELMHTHETAKRSTSCK